MTHTSCYIKTFDCQMNTYDSDKIADVLNHTHGITRLESPEKADILVMITCSVREKAEEKVYSELGRWHKDFKKKNPNIKICVGGCVASQEGKRIQQKLPFVDIVFGPQTIHRLPELIRRSTVQNKRQMDISFPEIEKFDYIPQSTPNGYSAYVSIMEGCSKYCSYCIVPYTRGEEFSRPFDKVLAEVASLEQRGIKEIVFLGQNVNDYQGIMEDGSYASLALLIHYTAALKGIERIRFTTSHPSSFSDDLIQCYAEEPKLANHLHLPVQSGSDRILSKMKRTYTALEYKHKMNKLKKARPGITISSDFIVGFPGETDEDFEKTLALVEDIGFDKSYSFIYSKRPGTPAASLEDNVTDEAKKRRLYQLQRALSIQEEKHSESMLNTTQRVLVTGMSKKTDGERQQYNMAGRTESNRVVHFAGSPSDEGCIKDVVIKKALKNALLGEYL